MCDPVSMTLAAVGTAASLAGSAKSASAQSSAASAIRDENYATAQAQNEAFGQRIAAQLQQTGAQQSIMDTTMAQRNAAAATMRQQQEGAMQRQQDTLAALNDAQTQNRNVGDTSAQTLLTNTNRQALDQAQAQGKQQMVALLDQNMPQGPGAPDPTTADPETQQALATRMAQASSNIRSYGGKIAQVASYGEPMETISNEIANNRTAIMPAQAASQLLQSSAPTLLLPSQVAYRNAADIGQAQDAVIQSAGQGQMNVAGITSNDQTQLANLKQSDADTIAANIQKQKTADAQFQQQIGGLISGIGNLGIYGAGYLGGAPSWLKPAGGPVMGPVGGGAPMIG